MTFEDTITEVEDVEESARLAALLEEFGLDESVEEEEGDDEVSS